MQLKPLFKKLETLAGSNILGALWKLGRLIVLVMVLIILASWIPELTPGFVSDFFNKGQGGIVIVDSPEVYSRERLINDRFRQASWLEKELDESPERSFGNQAISDLHKILRLDTSIGNSSPAPEAASAAKPAGEGGADAGNRNSPDTSVSPSERFRDIRAYREEIRTEMMETLLDDRHDIKGNTLYRLKFDTTVLPEEKTEKLAVIQVKLARADFCKPQESATSLKVSEPGSGAHHIPCISVAAIYDSWLKQTEEKINLAIDGTIKSIRRGSLSTSDFAELVRFLEVKVSRLNETEKWRSRNSFVSKQIENIGIWNQIHKFNPACVGKTIQQFRKRLPDESNAEYRKKRNNQFRSCPLVPIARFFPENANPETLARYHKLRNLLLYFYYDKLAYKSAHWEFIEIHEEFLHEKFDTFREDHESGNSRQKIPIELRIAKIREDAERAIANAEKLIADTRLRIAAAETPDAYDEKQIGFAERRIANAQQRIFETEKLMANTEDLIARAELAEQNLLRYAVVGMWIEKYTYKNDDRVEQCKKLYADQLEVFDPKSMSCIAHLEKTACNGLDFCTVRVEARIPEPRQNIICGEAEGDDKTWCDVQHTFERLLNIDETYYSYAVTPKESAQRVLTIASERRQKQLALSLLASSPNGLDAATVNSITSAFSQSAAQTEQIQRKPLILSFGRGQPVNTDMHDKVARGIDFGWIIGPKFVFADKTDGDIRFYHAPTHNSLSAVISVPSWWTTIGLEIDTCWIDQAELPGLEKITVSGLGKPESLARNYLLDFCATGADGAGHEVDIDYLVRLPGSAEELPRKFGYEIERVPAISQGGVLAEFYVGQKNASLIIQGQELWRSTVVTMGHQKADNIEVLPNMKGIIATFETIDSPSQKIEYVPANGRGMPSNCYVRSEVVVWTSEGRTVENQLFAKIHANPLLGPDSRAGKAAVYPEGFGSCSFADASRNRSSPAGRKSGGGNDPAQGGDPAKGGDPAQGDENPENGNTPD